MFQSSLPPGLEVCMGVHTEIPSLERTEEKEVRSRTDYYTITAEPRCTLYRIYIIFICTWVYTNVWAHMFIYEYIYIYIRYIHVHLCVCNFPGSLPTWFLRSYFSVKGNEIQAYLTYMSRCFYCDKLFMHIFRAQPKSCKDLNP